MFRRLLARLAPSQPDASGWWQEANALADSPDADRLAALGTRITDRNQAPDLAELQEEMLDGLERLLVFAQAPALPSIVTQHRVIGTAVCRFIAPVSLIEEVDACGKVFVTDEKLVFAAGAVRQWPWHTVASVGRVERDVVIDQRGRPGAARLRANSYADALVLVALARRLCANRS